MNTVASMTEFSNISRRRFDRQLYMRKWLYADNKSVRCSIQLKLFEQLGSLCLIQPFVENLLIFHFLLKALIKKCLYYENLVLKMSVFFCIRVCQELFDVEIKKQTLFFNHLIIKTYMNKPYYVLQGKLYLFL